MPEVPDTLSAERRNECSGKTERETRNPAHIQPDDPGR